MKPKRVNKRRGETYAQALAREKAEKRAYGYDVGMEVGKIVRNEVANDVARFLVLAANRRWGKGYKAIRDLFDGAYEISEEFDALARSLDENDKPDYEYARAKMDERILQISKGRPLDLKLKY